MAQVSFGEEMHKAGTIVEVFIINSSHQPASDCGGQFNSPFCALAKCIMLDCSRDQSNVRDGATQSLDYYSGAVNYGSSGNILNYIILADSASVSDRESGNIVGLHGRTRTWTQPHPHEDEQLLSTPRTWYRLDL